MTSAAVMAYNSSGYRAPAEGAVLGRGTGPNKRTAQTEAARVALANLANIDNG